MGFFILDSHSRIFRDQGLGVGRFNIEFFQAGPDLAFLVAGPLQYRILSARVVLGHSCLKFSKAGPFGYEFFQCRVGLFQYKTLTGRVVLIENF